MNTDTTSRNELVRTIALLAALCIAGAALGWWLSPRGQAPQQPAPIDPDTHGVVVPPYGGCKEATIEYAGTPGYIWCEQRGLLPD